MHGAHLSAAWHTEFHLPMQTRPGVPAPISTQFAGLSLSGSPPHPSYLAQRLQLSLPVLGRKLEGVPEREERDNIRCWRDTDWHKSGLPPAMENIALLLSPTRLPFTPWVREEPHTCSLKICSFFWGRLAQRYPLYGVIGIRNSKGRISKNDLGNGQAVVIMTDLTVPFQRE